MCGLTGVVIPRQNGFFEPDINVVLAQMFINAWRGADSTGAVLIDNKADHRWVKHIGPPDLLRGTKDWSNFRDVMYNKGQICFTHGRAATRGDVTIDNAHPFDVLKPDGKGRIILVHNGTLDQWQQLPGFKDHDVDSEWLAACIAKYGPKEALGKIGGPIATMWWDSDLKTFNVYRNDERPLFIVQGKFQQEMYINSEREALMWLKHKFNLNYEWDDIKTFSSGEHYWMNHNDYKSWKLSKIEKIAAPIIRAPSHHHVGSPYGLIYDEDDSVWGEESWTKDLLDNVAAEKSDPPWKDLGIRSYIHDCMNIFKGEISRVEWEYLASSNTYTRFTYIPGKGHIRTQNSPPYKPNLIRILCDATMPNMIEADYLNREKDFHWVERHLPPMMPKSSVSPSLLVSPVSLEKKRKEACVDGEFKCSEQREWTFCPKNGKEVKHWCLVDDKYDRHFAEYSNDIDGYFRVGDEITVEMYEFNPRSEKRIEVRGARIHPDHDKYIDFYFVLKDQVKEELEAMGFMKGRIKFIRLCNMQEWNDRGTFVHIMLEDLQPVYKNLHEVNPNAA